MQVNMSNTSSVTSFSHCGDIQAFVCPEDGSNNPPEEATEAGRRHVATARIS